MFKIEIKPSFGDGKHSFSTARSAVVARHPKSAFGRFAIRALAGLIILTGAGFNHVTYAASASAAGATQPEAAFNCSEFGEVKVKGKGFGTLDKPYQATSPWNRYPVKPTLDMNVSIPVDSYYPSVTEGQWSTGVFLADKNDPPATIIGNYGAAGVKDADTETVRPITIPHWPADVIPASAADGHADIVDKTTGVVHSFWQLKQVSGQWHASLYAWSCINGNGFADPAHYYQGARAVGVAPMAGLIRIAEAQDTAADTYGHALAMSLTYTGMSKLPIYVAPATQADGDAATANKGQISEGSLVMLPSTFDPKTLGDPVLQKVARTLQKYGAYIVDRNTGTPFVIYVENGSGLSLGSSKWNDLQRIRAALHPVTGARAWMDGEGNPMLTSTVAPNLLSMRGTWTYSSGDKAAGLGVFDTWDQSVKFPANIAPVTVINQSNRGLGTVSWAMPKTGDPMRFVALAKNGATIRMRLLTKTNWSTVYDSGDVGDGGVRTFSWPSQPVVVVLYATSGSGGTKSKVRGQLFNESTK